MPHSNLLCFLLIFPSTEGSLRRKIKDYVNVCYVPLDHLSAFQLTRSCHIYDALCTSACLPHSNNMRCVKMPPITSNSMSKLCVNFSKLFWILLRTPTRSLGITMLQSKRKCILTFITFSNPSKKTNNNFNAY